MAELVGTISAVVSLSSEGIKLAKTIRILVNEVRESNSEAHATISELDSTVSVLDLFKKNMELEQATKLVYERFFDEVRKIIADCDKIFADLRRALDHAVPGILDLGEDAESFIIRKRDSLRWPFSRIDILSTKKRLEGVKRELQLRTLIVMHVHQLEDDKRARRKARTDAKKAQRKKNDLMRLYDLRIKQLQLQSSLAKTSLEEADDLQTEILDDTELPLANASKRQESFGNGRSSTNKLPEQANSNKQYVSEQSNNQPPGPHKGSPHKERPEPGQRKKSPIRKDSDQPDPDAGEDDAASLDNNSPENDAAPVESVKRSERSEAGSANDYASQISAGAPINRPEDKAMGFEQEQPHPNSKIHFDGVTAQESSKNSTFFARLFRKNHDQHLQNQSLRTQDGDLTYKGFLISQHNDKWTSWDMRLPFNELQATVHAFRTKDKSVLDECAKLTAQHLDMIVSNAKLCDISEDPEYRGRKWSVATIKLLPKRARRNDISCIQIVFQGEKVPRELDQHHPKQRRPKFVDDQRDRRKESRPPLSRRPQQTAQQGNYQPPLTKARLEQHQKNLNSDDSESLEVEPESDAKPKPIIMQDHTPHATNQDPRIDPAANLSMRQQGPTYNQQAAAKQDVALDSSSSEPSGNQAAVIESSRNKRQSIFPSTVVGRSAWTRPTNRRGASRILRSVVPFSADEIVNRQSSKARNNEFIFPEFNPGMPSYPQVFPYGYPPFFFTNQYGYTQNVGQPIVASGGLRSHPQKYAVPPYSNLQGGFGTREQRYEMAEPSEGYGESPMPQIHLPDGDVEPDVPYEEAHQRHDRQREKDVDSLFSGISGRSSLPPPKVDHDVAQLLKKYADVDVETEGSDNEDEAPAEVPLQEEHGKSKARVEES